MSSSGANAFGLGDQLARNLAFLDSGGMGDSEFSWGDGLVPIGLEDAPPSEGGMYRGQSPPCEKRIGR